MIHWAIKVQWLDEVANYGKNIRATIEHSRFAQKWILETKYNFPASSKNKNKDWRPDII